MIGRVIEEHKTNYIIVSNDKEYSGVVRGKFHIADTEAFPKVGDIVVCVQTSDDQVVIERILPRRTEIARKAVGSTARQIMVTNVDVMFVIMGLDDDFNPRRLERYLVLAKQSGVETVVVLNKADLVSNTEEYIQRAKDVSRNVPIYAISASLGNGMNIFANHMSSDSVAVLLGSSGAGKSTIMNWLLNEQRQATNTVREDDSHGRHTTTVRQMFALPQGGFLIDTPGMRELGVLGNEEDETGVFADIEELRRQCKFADCDHEKSEGCAIKVAVAKGTLDEKRLESYLKLQREREYLESKNDEESAYERKQRIRKLHTSYTDIQKQKGLERDSF